MCWSRQILNLDDAQKSEEFDLINNLINSDDVAWCYLRPIQASIDAN